MLKDVSLEKAEAGLAAVQQDHRAAGRQGPAWTRSREAKLLGLITPTADAGALDGCDLIIEAVFENRDAEGGGHARGRADARARTACSRATPRRCRSAAWPRRAPRPERFVGLHFFSPVHKMQLVEIIRGKQTSDETIARAYDYVLALGKTPIVVNDSRGFFTSRVFGTFVMEGAAMLAEGIPAPLIEHAALAVGMPVGPLAVLDETSLSLSVHVMDQTRADLAAEGRSHAPSRGRAAGRAHGQGAGAPGPRRRRRLLRLSAGRAEAPLAGAEDAVREAGRRRARTSRC